MTAISFAGSIDFKLAIGVFDGRVFRKARLGLTIHPLHIRYNVSYDTVDAIKNSRVGDHVLVCLMYIPDPDKCPPGDVRGRIYTVTNLRTIESWTLPDSQHMCGGA